MNYIIEYKSIFEILTLIKEMPRIEKLRKIDGAEIEIHSTIILDIIIVKDDENKTIEILCQDKKTLDRLYYFAYNKIFIQNLTQLYRCFIINYSDIISIMKYKEFCGRYYYER